jgi:subfamily B ATP-binding cassette protein MsbA
VNPTRRLLQLIAPYRARVVLALALAVLACLLNLPIPLLIQAMVDRAATGGGGHLLPPFALALFGVFAAHAMVGVASVHTLGPVGLGVVRDLRHALYARLQRLGLPFYDRTSTGAIISRLMDDVAVIQSLITGQSLVILTDLGTTLVVSGVLLTLDLGLALVMLGVLAAYAVTFRAFTRRIRAGSAEVRDRLDRVFGHLKEKLDGVLVVKACAREDAEIADFAGRIDEAHGPRVRVGWLGAAFSNLSAGLNGVGSALVFAVGAYEALRGRMTPGEVVSTATLAGLLFGPVARLADLASIFEQAAASSDRLGEILDMQPDVVEPATPRPIGRARGLVEFDRVGFGYKAGEPVVWDVRLKAEPGMKVALVGPTGCGKSTLMNLLLRFYDPTEGQIRLDGIPLPELATADLRRQVGVVHQEPVVFAQSLADNIRYGAPDADRARVEAAARAALVHEFAVALPEGYETRVGEGGHRLSQGERQRLSIARAFCMDPSLVILDEATSALDSGGEALIQAALANLLAGRTTFVIAHRLATVVDADLIVVLDGGLVVQVGDHEGLLDDADGLYRRLCLRQFGGSITPGRLRPGASNGPSPFVPFRGREAPSFDRGTRKVGT